MGDLVERLRKGSKNVELARQHGVAGYLAGWEHQTMAEAAALIEEAREILTWAMAEAEGKVQYESVVEHALAVQVARSALAKLEEK